MPARAYRLLLRLNFAKTIQTFLMKAQAWDDVPPAVQTILDMVCTVIHETYDA